MAFCLEAISSTTDACVVWPFAIDRGYAVMGDGGRRRILVSRWICEKVYGPSPTPKHEVAHLPVICHNRSCINPRHLRWATRQENQNDRLLDDTAVRGERVGTSKLIAAQVIAIRSRWASGEVSQRALGAEYGVSQALISDIVHGARWRHLL
jgi:hypothetical protein